MDIRTWLKKRGISFVLRRGRILMDRYGLGTSKAEQRIDHLMDLFAQYHCAPTFPVPGIVVERHFDYIRSLHERGAEIAVHGYNHVSLNTCPPKEAVKQLQQAVEVFNNNRLPVFGFRCPYLSSSDALMEALPGGMFGYSSNKAVRWEVPPPVDGGKTPDTMFNVIDTFYIPHSADAEPCLPYMQNGMVEIPVSVPDDLQLRDGLGYTQADLSRAWIDIMMRTYQRGELFNLMFHPELADFCTLPFSVLLNAARTMCPELWVARLQDVMQWWLELSLIHI